MPTRRLIFTDLDGTLLDSATYDRKPARPALALIRKKSIPLIICTSKTRAEIEVRLKRFRLREPFIAENGAAIYIPKNYFAFHYPWDRGVDGYRVIELGIPYARIRKGLKQIARRTGLPLGGFGDMTAAEIAAQTGLPIQEARLAKRREHDEPFVLDEPDLSRRGRLIHGIAEMGLGLDRGRTLFPSHRTA